MKGVLITLLSNAALAGILAYPVYLWRALEGMEEMLAAAAAVAFVFTVTGLVFHGLFMKFQVPSTSMAMGKMFMHMALMGVCFFLAGPVTGLKTEPVVLWMIGFFFVNLGIEAAILIKTAQAEAGKAG